MNKYIVTYSYNAGFGVKQAESFPIEAEDEEDASIKFKDVFESAEGISCNIISVKKC